MRFVYCCSYLIDQKVRHATNLGCALGIKCKGKREKAFSDVAGQENFHVEDVILGQLM